MNKFRLSCKRLSIWVLLFTQILLITSYFYLKVDTNSKSTNYEDTEDKKITFVQSDNVNEAKKSTYHTIDSKIFLKSISSRESFIDFNSSLCYINGTDLVSMKKNKNLNWECNCQGGWHGKDCGQPEIIWRAYLTYKKPLKISGPRMFQRRLIYIFPIDKFSKTIAEIRIYELGEVVDLFVLYEPEDSNFMGSELNRFVKEYHEKIIYFKTNNIDELWSLIKDSVKNLRNDDVVIVSTKDEIPNKYALNYLKFYSKLPEPIRFRLRWSVYGFFWLHPQKTIIMGAACSVSYLKEIFNSKLSALCDDYNSSLYKGIILGDLNHFGGWYCEYCQDGAQILESLSKNPPRNLDFSKINNGKIDSNYIEDCIENGLYLDGKTELTRTHKYRDNYFAPFYVIENDWKYDFLLINFYSKLDYEG